MEKKKIISETKVKSHAHGDYRTSVCNLEL